MELCSSLRARHSGTGNSALWVGRTGGCGPMRKAPLRQRRRVKLSSLLQDRPASFVNWGEGNSFEATVRTGARKPLGEGAASRNCLAHARRSRSDDKEVRLAVFPILLDPVGATTRSNFIPWMTPELVDSHPRHRSVTDIEVAAAFGASRLRQFLSEPFSIDLGQRSLSRPWVSFYE